jgi:Methyltransferase FkbM domain
MKVNRTYVLRSGLAQGLKKRGGLGIRQALRRRGSLSPEDAFLQSVDFTGQTIFDIGGFMGGQPSLSLSPPPPPDFVKIDVEGLELAVLEGMAETVREAKPAIFVEIHGRNLEAKEANARRVIEWLHDHVYDILHVESGQTVTPDSPEIAREGHLYASIVSQLSHPAP